MHMQGRILPIPLSTVPTRVRLLKGKPKIETMQYPTLQPSSWATYMLENCSEVLLGGNNIHSVANWQGLLADFWSKFQRSQPEIVVPDPQTSIPIAIHGDEGRGKAKRPIMCLAIQTLINHLGPAVTNTSGPGSEFSKISLVSFGFYLWVAMSRGVQLFSVTLQRFLYGIVVPQAQLLQQIPVHGCAE